MNLKRCYKILVCLFSHPLECDASLSGIIQEWTQKPRTSVSPASACAIPVTRPLEQNAQPVFEGRCFSNKRTPRLAGAVLGSSAVHVPSHPRGEQVSHPSASLNECLFGTVTVWLFLLGRSGNAREAKWGLERSHFVLHWAHDSVYSKFKSTNLLWERNYCSAVEDAMW